MPIGQVIIMRNMNKISRITVTKTIKKMFLIIWIDELAKWTIVTREIINDLVFRWISRYSTLMASNNLVAFDRSVLFGDKNYYTFIKKHSPFVSTKWNIYNKDIFFLKFLLNVRFLSYWELTWIEMIMMMTNVKQFTSSPA